jgi:hypothetical protein
MKNNPILLNKLECLVKENFHLSLTFMNKSRTNTDGTPHWG